MKVYGISITGTIITKETASGYLLRVAKILQQNLTMESSIVLDEIEERIIKAGFLTKAQCEEIEIRAL